MIHIDSVWREKRTASHVRLGVDLQTFKVTGRRADGRYQTVKISGSGKKQTNVTSAMRILGRCEMVSPGSAAATTAILDWLAADDRRE